MVKEILKSKNRSIAGSSVLYENIIEVCLVFLIIFTPLAYGAVEYWSIAVFEATAAVMAFIWILKMVKNGEFIFVKSPLTVIIFVFIAYICIRLLPYGNMQKSSLYIWATKTELLKILAYSMIYFVAINVPALIYNLL